MRLSLSLILASAILGFLVSPSSVLAQTTLADLRAQIDIDSQELDEIDTLLSDVDPNRRAAAINLLIKSGNSAFVERAIEVGLLSDDPRMRAVSLQKVLETGGPFTLDIQLTDAEEENTSIRKWLSDYGKGSWNESDGVGTTVFAIDDFDQKNNCWPFLNVKKCALVVDGERVMLAGWQYAVGALTLQDDGTLEGTFGYSYGDQSAPLPASIRLIE